jgi:hypothetical protein
MRKKRKRIQPPWTFTFKQLYFSFCVMKSPITKIFHKKLHHSALDFIILLSIVWFQLPGIDQGCMTLYGFTFYFSTK